MVCDLRNATGVRHPTPATGSPPDRAGGVPAAAGGLAPAVEWAGDLTADPHAHLVPRLSALGFGLASLASRLDGQHRGRAMALVHELDEIVRVARDGAVGASRARPGGLELQGYLGEITARAGEVGGARALFSAVGPVGSVPEPVSVHLRAVLVEALTNVVRHAGAGTLSVVLRTGDELTLTVADDGVGIPENPAGGIGLVVMAARARVLGGRFHVGPGGAGGTVVRWHVPLTRPGRSRTGPQADPHGRRDGDPVA